MSKPRLSMMIKIKFALGDIAEECITKCLSEETSLKEMGEFIGWVLGHWPEFETAGRSFVRDIYFDTLARRYFNTIQTEDGQ